MRGTSREKFDCLDLLTGGEALAVLRELLSLHPDILPDTRRAANALLARVSFTDIAKSVFDALLALDLDDLDAGQRAGGYVEPKQPGKRSRRWWRHSSTTLERRVTEGLSHQGTPRLTASTLMGPPRSRGRMAPFALRLHTEQRPEDFRVGGWKAHPSFNIERSNARIQARIRNVAAQERR